MLDPNRYSLDAATVGFRKRMRQSVNWDNFNEALQTQTESIKVRRELKETPISEVHVMGGQRYGWAGNSKTNEIARQERQMNGYPLRSFYATGGAIVLPIKRSEGLLATPQNVGLTSYAQYNGVVGNYVSAFTEPLNAPLDSGMMMLARAGRQARSEAIENPYKFLQFQLNMHSTQEQIKKNEQQHQELRGYNKQAFIGESIQEENAKLAKAENIKQLKRRKPGKALLDAGATTEPGSGTALLGHLPNIHTAAPTLTGSSEAVERKREEGTPEFELPELGSSLENAGLLDVHTGEELAHLEETAEEEKTSGMENVPAQEVLKSLSEEEQAYINDVTRLSRHAQEIFNGGDDELKQALINSIMEDKVSGLTPSTSATYQDETTREQMIELHSINHWAEQMGVSVNTSSMYDHSTSNPAVDLASIIADGARTGVDGLMPVEELSVSQARIDSQQGFGANALEIQYGGMNSVPRLGLSALTPFALRRASDTAFDLSSGGIANIRTPDYSSIGQTDVEKYMEALQGNPASPINLNFNSPAYKPQVATAGRQNLMSQITAGTKLKKTETPVVRTTGRQDLMSQIRLGTNLKKTETVKKTKKEHFFASGLSSNPVFNAARKQRLQQEKEDEWD